MELSRARRLAMDMVTPSGVEWVGLEEAPGRVLRETLVALEDIPREARSRLDGFALRSADISGASSENPAMVRILPGLLAAGHATGLEVGPRECVRILTGAPIPLGTDAVVPQEDVHREGDRLLLKQPAVAGRGITPPGQEARKGIPVLSEGDLLTPTRLAIAAAIGRSRIAVSRRSRVALLATGDEVREIGSVLQGPWTFCNSRLLLGWLTRLQGGEAIHLGVERDDAQAIAGRIRDVEAEVVITTGGIGHGDRDFILDAWRELGVETIFRSVKLSPGKNTALGRKGRQIFWACPGNPWAGQIVFEELIAPALRRASGLTGDGLPSVAARLDGSIKKKRGFCKAVRGILNTRVFPPSFTPSSRVNATLFETLGYTLAHTILDSHVSEAAEGSTVEVRPDDLPLLSFPLFAGQTLPS